MNVRIVKIIANYQIFYVIGRKLSNDNFKASFVLDSCLNEINDIIEAFDLWEKVENKVIEKLLK